MLEPSDNTIDSLGRRLGMYMPTLADYITWASPDWLHVQCACATIMLRWSVTCWVLEINDAPICLLSEDLQHMDLVPKLCVLILELDRVGVDKVEPMLQALPRLSAWLYLPAHSFNNDFANDSTFDDYDDSSNSTFVDAAFDFGFDHA